MNKDLQDKLSHLEEFIGIQRDSVTPGTHHDYMHGMLNGLIFAHSLFTDIRPSYHTVRSVNRRDKKIRHKVHRLRGKP